jgi:hypothetical protein
MSLSISTFSNENGPECLFKALGHPLVSALAAPLLGSLRSFGPVAVYDPFSIFETFAALYNVEGINIDSAYVQDIDHVGRLIGGVVAQPISLLPLSKAEAVFIVAFDVDANKVLSHIEHLLPSEIVCITLDRLRLSDSFLSNEKHYLSPMNFGTNFAFFRDSDDLHTRLTSVNYWHSYGARSVKLWLRLFDEEGGTLASWEQKLPDQGAAIVIDSRDVRKRFDLGPFRGQLFVHAIGIVGHEIIKYVLDVFSDGYQTLSCTHDANAWPADLYAGLPAPDLGEEVVLWVQNSHPVTIPPNSIGLSCMGEDAIFWIDKGVKPFATIPVNVADFLPDEKWGRQLEIHAGKYLVRPRYEITDSSKKRRIAHVNVERTDLVPDPNLSKIKGIIGKGYLLPAPVLPTNEYDVTVLWTPMATTQAHLAAKLSTFDKEGREVGSQTLRIMDRAQSMPISVSKWLQISGVDPGESFGHVELTYDFDGNIESDGWLHAIFRYKNLSSGHQSETSFGSHIFNLPVTYKGEPQSYAGPPPGLSTRLYVRLGETPLDTLLHIIYPASMPWREKSATTMTLMDSSGAEVASWGVEIPCSGSRLLSARDMFGSKAINRASPSGYISIRDSGCRLFGYHALVHPDGAFCLDHMFGF